VKPTGAVLIPDKGNAQVYADRG